jgi:hypothetical protein
MADKEQQMLAHLGVFSLLFDFKGLQLFHIYYDITAIFGCFFWTLQLTKVKNLRYPA